MIVRRSALVLLVAAILPGTAAAQSSQRGATFPATEAPNPASRWGTVILPPAPDENVMKLRADLERLVRTGASRNAQQGVLVVSLDRGDTLFSFNPDLPLAPASNMKLFSTAAALYYLGPNFRYSTYAL